MAAAEEESRNRYGSAFPDRQTSIDTKWPERVEQAGEVIGAIIDGCSDDEVRNTYMAGEGECGIPIGDLLLAKIERRRPAL
nr:hypothetical protein [uncultured Sphingomonas sp.]